MYPLREVKKFLGRGASEGWSCGQGKGYGRYSEKEVLLVPVKAETDHVLVIDDNLNICELTKRTLEEYGYQVSVCADGTRALRVLGEAPNAYGCVLLDLRMEGLEGTELLPLIKHQYPTLPVVIVSSYANPPDANYYDFLGASDVVHKPFSSERLLEAVHRAVGTMATIQLVLPNLSLHDARDQTYCKVIVLALRRANWNQVKAAELLGVSRHCLLRWMQKLHITC